MTNDRGEVTPFERREQGMQLSEATRSESIKELISALSKAQGQMHGAGKKSENPYFKSLYADLASVWETCRQPLSQNGFAVIQTTEPTEDNTVCLITTLAHSSGEWVKSKLKMKPVKDDPQGIGSCITYARRYSLMAMVGIAPEDDDGETAMGRDKKKAPSASPKAKGKPSDIKLGDILNGAKEEKHKVTRTEVGGMLIELTGSKEKASAKLRDLTSFKGRDGEMITGKSSLADISEAQLLVVYGKVKELLSLKKAKRDNGGPPEQPKPKEEKGLSPEPEHEKSFAEEITDEKDESFPGVDIGGELSLAQEGVADAIKASKEDVVAAMKELKINTPLSDLTNEACVRIVKRTNIIIDRRG